MTYITKLYRSDTIIKYVMFPINSEYRAVVSMDYFNAREHKRLNSVSVGQFKEFVWAHIVTEQEYKELCADWLRLSINLNIENKDLKVPRINVNSIWDMYKEIGYDYKKQKYI